MSYLRWINGSNYHVFWNSLLSSHGKQAKRKTQIVTIMGPPDGSHPGGEGLDISESHFSYKELKKDFGGCIRRWCKTCGNQNEEQTKLIVLALNKFMVDIETQPKLR